MMRVYCPWCNRMVELNSADQIKTVNGRGMFKTEIYAHRSCYEKWRLENDRKKVSQTDKENE